MRRRLAGTVVGLLAIAVALLAATSRASTGARVHTKEFNSGTFAIDRVYRSMRGPVDDRLVKLGEPGEHRRVWITGLDVEALDGSTAAPIDGGQRFICHVNFSHPDREGWARQLAARQSEGRSVPFNWFTLIQGHYTIDFPPGFGVPADSDQQFRFFSMAQNQDPKQAPLNLTIRSRFRYLYDDQLTTAMTPLNKFSWDVRVAAPFPFDDQPGKDGCEGDDAAAHQTAAKPGEPVLHFAVQPGRHEFRMTLPGASKIPFDTTAHHISAHLHVYGESLELRDATAGKSLFTSRATSNSAKTGIVEMTDYSSAEGIPIYRDHSYELVAVYDNTTDHVIDAMAVVYIYYKDRPLADQRSPSAAR